MDREQFNEGGTGTGPCYSRRCSSEDVAVFKHDSEGTLALSRFNRAGHFSYRNMTHSVDPFNVDFHVA